MPLAKFYIYSPQEFQNYVMSTNFSRTITMIQNHHTWEPNYSSITPAHGEMYWMESMRSYHIDTNGWRDIGQNITTFPSGFIGLCRPIDITPAGIFGANGGAICIEHLGNFDAGHDIVTPSHKETIGFVNAVLCIKFKLSPVKEQVVYHHWFDKTGARFSDDKINNNLVGNEQKTCPGTAFFGTNTITSAEANFYPLIANKIAQLTGTVLLASSKKVNTGVLNVRSGPGTSFQVLRTTKLDDPVNVYTTRAGWSKISNTANEWVFSTYLT